MRKADPQDRTPSEPRANPKPMQIFEKRTRSGPKANLGCAFGVRFGVRLGPVGTVYINRFKITGERNQVENGVTLGVLKNLLFPTLKCTGMAIKQWFY